MTQDDVRTIVEIAACLRRFASSFHGLISARFYDGVLFVHVEERTMVATFGETAVWKWQEDKKYPIRLEAQAGGVIWFALFTERRAAQCGCSLVM